MSKPFWAIIAVIVVLFGGILLFKGDKANAPTSSSAKPTSHIMGSDSSGVTLVEYGDYQCIFCGQYYPVVKEISEKYKGQIIFQFSNLPLSEVHRNAFAAARAAEAAGLQNKYWEMHDLLYENQSTWSESNKAQDYFDQYARQLGLNLETFKKDASSSKVNDFINADLAAFNKLGLRKSTPTFVLNGKQIVPDDTVESFSTFIDEAIAKKAEAH